MTVEKIILNGNIYTEDPRKPWVEAVAVQGKKIIYTGSNEGARQLASEGTEVIDLGGRTVIPGLIDGHTHPTTVAKTFWRVRIPLTHDKDELFDNIRKALKKYPKVERPYFFCENYFAEIFGPDGPDKKELDALVSDRPARIQDFTDHACWYNSMALEMLTGEDGKPFSASPVGCAEFKKDENGEYTGWCHEAGPDGDYGIYEKLGWKPPEVVDEEMIKPLLDFFRHYGIMCMMDGFTEGDENMKFFYELDKAGRLGMFYEATSILGQPKDLEASIAKVREWQEKYTSEHVHCNTIKFFIDGTNEMGDCLSTQPFANDPTGTNYGSAFAEEEEVRDILVRLNEERIDLHVHTICDGAFRRMCNAVEAAQKICGDDWSIKVTLAHCEIIHPDDVHRVYELGIYIDWSTHWSGGYFGEEAQNYLGRERWDTMYDFTKIINAGEHVGFSSDVFSYQEAMRADPYFGMQVAMTRVDPLVPLDPDRYPGSVRPPASAKLDLKQLIHGYTMTNAIRMRLDHLIGSIEEGKLANMVVLENDIFEMPAEKISETEVAFTIFEGQVRDIKSDLSVQR